MWRRRLRQLSYPLRDHRPARVTAGPYALAGDADSLTPRQPLECAMKRRRCRRSVAGLLLAALVSLALQACVAGPNGATAGDDGPPPGPPITEILCNNAGCDA